MAAVRGMVNGGGKRMETNMASYRTYITRVFFRTRTGRMALTVPAFLLRASAYRCCQAILSGKIACVRAPSIYLKINERASAASRRALGARDERKKVVSVCGITGVCVVAKDVRQDNAAAYNGAHDRRRRRRHRAGHSQRASTVGYVVGSVAAPDRTVNVWHSATTLYSCYVVFHTTRVQHRDAGNTAHAHHAHRALTAIRITAAKGNRMKRTIM